MDESTIRYYTISQLYRDFRDLIKLVMLPNDKLNYANDYVRMMLPSKDRIVIIDKGRDVSYECYYSKLEMDDEARNNFKIWDTHLFNPRITIDEFNNLIYILTRLNVLVHMLQITCTMTINKS